MKRCKQIKFRATDSEYFKILRTAGRAGLSISSFVRARCLDDKKILIVDSADIQVVYQALNAFGNNLNGVARIAYEQNTVDETTVLSLLANLRDVRLTVAERLKGMVIK